MSVKHGVDLEAFRSFAEHAGQHPEEVQFELGANAAYEGRAGHSLAKVDGFVLGGETIERETREYTFPFGAWREVEEAAGFVGPTDRPEPIEVALAALAGCLNVAVSFTALHEGSTSRIWRRPSRSTSTRASSSSSTTWRTPRRRSRTSRWR